MSRKGKFIEIESRSVDASQEVVVRAGISSGHKGTFWDIENVPKLIEVIVIQLYKFTKNNWILHLQMSEFYVI